MVNIKHACKYSITTQQEQKLELAWKSAIEEFTEHNISQDDKNIDVQNHSNLKKIISVIPRLGKKILIGISAEG